MAITRYDDAERALCDPRLLKAMPFDDLPVEVRPLVRHMLACDPPVRVIQRHFATPALTSSATA
ncbi:MAG: hypothetical protein ACRDQU_19855 [Pseudonocardiaceae bacterium]